MPVVPNKYRGSKEYYLIYSELITAAKYKGTISYQEIANIMGLPMRGSYMGSQIGHLLGEISEDEFNSGRPMLSAVAVNVHGEPGLGFYSLARDLGRLDKVSDGVDKAFWESELQDVYETWKVIIPEE